MSLKLSCRMQQEVVML